MKRVGFGIALLGILAASATGQDAVTIKVPTFKTGDRVKVTKTEKTKSAVSVAAGGQTQKKDNTTTKTIVYVDEVITPADKGGKPLKLKRTYEKFEVSKDSGKDEPGPPLNTPITIEKKGEKYEFTSEKALDKAFSAKLSAEFEKSKVSPDALLPGKPVKPGDTWKIDGEKLTALTGGDAALVFDNDKSEVTGKLVKTYQKDGRQFGVIEYAGTVGIKGLGEKVPLTVKAGSKVDFKMTLDGCIDGTTQSSAMNGTLKVKLDAEGGGLVMGVVADGTITETQELLPKK